LPFLVPAALPLAVFIVIFEAVLGFMLLVGYQRRFTMWSLLLMIVFFTFLTFYSAYFNKVTDCGCFGDALKLTPWESFWKDIVLLVFILILFFNQHLIKPLFNKPMRNILVGISIFACLFMGYYVLSHLPLIDFRAYKVGTDIRKGMEIPEGAPRDVVDMTFIYEVNGQRREFTENDLMSLPDGAKFIDRKDVVVTKGYVPPIHDFTIEKDGADYTQEFLEEPKVLMFTSYDLSKSDASGWAKLELLTKDAREKGYEVMALTSSGAEEIHRVKTIHKLSFDFYFCDATTIKTIERANPSLLVLHKGVVVQKLHHNDVNEIKL
jgi:hypothetical protein